MDRDGVTLDRLRSLVVFARHMNLSSAAEELHVSQPSLQVKIQNLAHAIGSPLYVRRGRALEMTPTGWDVVRFGQSMDLFVDEFSRAMGDAVIEPLTLAAGSGAHRFVIATAVRHMIASGRRLRLLTTNSDETIDCVRRGDASVGVTVLSRVPKGLRATEIATYPQVAVIPTNNPLSRRRSLSFADLGSVDVAAPPPDRPQRAQLEKVAKANGVVLRVVAEGEGWAQLLHFAELGVGVCVVNGCVTPEGEVVVRVIDDLPAVTYSAVYRSTRVRDPEVLTVVDALRASAP